MFLTLANSSVFVRIKEIDTQLQREHKLLFQKKQELQILRAMEKNFVADISGSRVALSNLDNRLSKLDQKALKQQEYINNQARHPGHRRYFSSLLGVLNALAFEPPYDPRCCSQASLTYRLLCTRFLILQEFQIQLLEGKMARLSGNVNKEEKQALERQVSELSEALEEKKKAAALLAAQLKKLQVKIRWWKAAASANCISSSLKL